MSRNCPVFSLRTIRALDRVQQGETETGTPPKWGQEWDYIVSILPDSTFTPLPPPTLPPPPDPPTDPPPCPCVGAGVPIAVRAE